MPEGMHSIFDRMLLQITKNKRAISSTNSRSVKLAIQPLSLLDLAEGVKVQPKKGIGIERAILGAVAFCGPFLKVNRGVMTLIYQPARVYLLTQTS